MLLFEQNLDDLLEINAQNVIWTYQKFLSQDHSLGFWLLTGTYQTSIK
jgi:hypothetical protein